MTDQRQSEILRGARANLPLVLSVAAYGAVLGVLAAQKHLAWGELLFMNAAVFAGAAQFVMVDMWNHPLPLLEMTLAVLVINLRYALIGASLRPLFQGKSLAHKMGVMHLVADENWAVTMTEHRKGRAGTWFLLGGGLCLGLAWCCGTLLGLLFGAAIAHPEAYALDFAFAAVFTALAMGLWRGKADILPWLVAAGLAYAAYAWLPGKWYAVAGGLGGAVTAMLLPEPAGNTGQEESDTETNEPGYSRAERGERHVS